MRIGDKVKFDKGVLGTIIKIEGTYGLIKFNHGQFVFNLNKILNERVVKQCEDCYGKGYIFEYNNIKVECDCAN